jgi:hypothetical protein
LKRREDSDKTTEYVYVPSHFDPMGLENILPSETFSKGEDDVIHIHLTESQANLFQLFCFDHDFSGLITPAASWPFTVSDDSKGPTETVYF